MTKHFLISSLENGVSLIAKESHGDALAAVDHALKSNILAGFDITSMQLPRGEQTAAVPGNDDGFWPEDGSWFAAMRPYRVVNGILSIPVKGVLFHGVGITYGQYFTGYEYLVRAMKRGLDDPAVTGIVLNIHSPGGHVSGCFDLCDMIAGAKKPTVAFVADYAASAAYAIASSCRKIVGTQTCHTGSIGVLATFIDETKYFDKMGIAFKYVSAPEGGYKEEGNPGTEISKELLERTQAGVNETYEVFVACVARGRKGKMTPEAIRATQALTFTKTASLDMGLIDMVASSVDIPTVAAGVFESFGPDGDDEEETISAPVAVETAIGAELAESENRKEHEMTDEEKAAMIANAKAEGAKEATAAATKAATDRIAAILGSEEATGRDDLAKHFAFNTEMSAESAVAALKVSPRATAPQPNANSQSQSFDKQMQQHAPNLSPNTATGNENEDGEDDTDKKSAASLNATKALVAKIGLAGYRRA